MAERVVLHIGAMKTGTSYIQDRLFANRETLAQHGVLLPSSSWRKQVQAVSEVLRPKRQDLGNPEGGWQELVDRANAFDGTVLISMEYLARARPKGIRDIVESFPGAEVQAVITLRDLNRNIPAMWQETVQNYASWTWESYLSGARRPLKDKHLAKEVATPRRNFWLQQGFDRIVRNWVDVVGREQFTIVTLPLPGAAPEVLWERFCEAVGMDPAWAAPVPRSNEALGAASTLVLRRVNEALAERGMKLKEYRPLVKQRLAKRGLASRKSKEPAIGLKAPSWLKRRSRSMIGELATMDLRVIGDLAELEPVDVPGVDPREVAVEDQLDAAVAAVVETILLWAEDRAGRS